MVFSLLNLSVSHKWGIGPSSLHTSSPKIEQTASCRPWMWPPSGRETGPRLNHTRAWAQEWGWIRSWGCRFTLPDAPVGVISHNSALPVTGGENFLPAQNWAESHILSWKVKWGKKECNGSWNPTRGHSLTLGGRGSLGPPLHGRKSDWAPTSPSLQPSPSSSSWGYGQGWGRGNACMKSCFVLTSSSESAQRFLIPSCIPNWAIPNLTGRWRKLRWEVYEGLTYRWVSLNLEPEPI